MSHRTLAAVLVALITIGVVAGVLGHGFVSWGDRAHILDDPDLRLPADQALARIWTQPSLGRYVPVARSAWLGLAALSSATGASSNPMIFHAANLLAHALSALLVFAIVRRLVESEEAALAGALLFALHPVQAEPVAWAAQLPRVLGGMFALLALWQYLVAIDDGRRRQTALRAQVRYGLATLVFALALLSDPATAALPLLAFAIDAWALRRPWRMALKVAAPWLLLAVPVAFAAGWAAHMTAPETAHLAPWTWLLLAGDALAVSLGKLALPWPLAPDYALSAGAMLARPWAPFAWLAPVAVGVGIWLARRRAPWLIAAGVVFAGALLPALAAMPLAGADESVVSDTALYLAMLGPALALACALQQWQWRWLQIVCGAALAGLAALTVLQVAHWRDDEALLAHTLTATPASWRAHGTLAASMLAEGRADEAIAHLESAARLHPTEQTQIARATALARAGRAEEAIASLREAVRRDPELVAARRQLGLMLSAAGQTLEAIEHLQVAVAARPDDALAQYTLAVELVHMGRRAEALEPLAAALRAQPDYADARDLLGRVLGAMERDALVPDTGP